MNLDLPRSAMIVLKNLTTEGPMTPKAIISRINLPSRTITFALSILLKERIVKRVPNLADMRQPFYHVNLDRVKELQVMFRVDKASHLQPEIRQGSHQGGSFTR